MHEIKRVIEHRITILMFNHIVILQRILKSFIKSKFDSTRFFPVQHLHLIPRMYLQRWQAVTHMGTGDTSFGAGDTSYSVS